MKGDTDMIDYREAQKIVNQQAHSFGTEKIGLEEADGRVLAEPILADRDYPPFNRSTMDGYAIRFADLKKNIRAFRIVETIYAGAAATRPALPGECYKIMTGAPVPDGMDVVIRREEVSEQDGIMTANPGIGPDPGAGPDEKRPFPNVEKRPSPNGEWRPFLNIASQGEDMRSGEAVISGPCICEPPVIGLLASLGKTELRVQVLPRVALLTTGDEVVPADIRPGNIQIRNSNRWLLQSLLKGKGIGVSLYQHAPDDPSVLKDCIQSALTSDILILCGGVSAGDADYVPSVLEGLGIKKLFHKMAIKPGKPTWCGIAPSGTMVFALPGNPFSCLVNFVLLIQPFLQACFGLVHAAPAGLPLGSFKKKKTPLDEFFPVRLHGSPGRLLPAPLNGSGDIRLGLSANALALHPADSGDLEEGASVLYYPI
jgi:molybdopterin molybdotransferase